MVFGVRQSCTRKTSVASSRSMWGEARAPTQSGPALRGPAPVVVQGVLELDRPLTEYLPSALVSDDQGIPALFESSLSVSVLFLDSCSVSTLYVLIQDIPSRRGRCIPTAEARSSRIRL